MSKSLTFLEFFNKYFNNSDGDVTFPIADLPEGRYKEEYLALPPGEYGSRHEKLLDLGIEFDCRFTKTADGQIILPSINQNHSKGVI